jgi:hypothetical protein
MALIFQEQKTISKLIERLGSIQNGKKGSNTLFHIGNKQLVENKYSCRIYCKCDCSTIRSDKKGVGSKGKSSKPLACFCLPLETYYICLSSIADTLGH